MTKMDFLSKEEVFEQILGASFQGTLGLFAGSGFTKAMLSDSSEYNAYDWKELLYKCCKDLNVSEEVMQSKGSYPEIASMICKQYSINEEINISKSVQVLKESIAKTVLSYPSDTTKQFYSGLFSKLKFNWVITTNYDTLIETLIPDKAFSISPNDSFIKTENLIPIYHIHGIRTYPESIIITNEDYVSLFRPNDYRQSRLPFLIKESLVLMIGYGFGDINVITAIDWSKHVYTNVTEGYDFPIIQILYKENPKDKPYRDPSGIIIFETNDLRCFFSELMEFYKEYERKYDNKCKEVFEYMQFFKQDTDSNIESFIRKQPKRLEVVKFVEDLSLEFRYIYPSYISFLRRVINVLISDAEPYGAFEAYQRRLEVLLDILENMTYKNMPTAFFQLVADSFFDLAYYIGTNLGQSFSAERTWNGRKDRIPRETVIALKEYAYSRGHGNSNMDELLRYFDNINENA